MLQNDRFDQKVIEGVAEVSCFSCTISSNLRVGRNLGRNADGARDLSMHHFLYFDISCCDYSAGAVYALHASFAVCQERLRAL